MPNIVDVLAAAGAAIDKSPSEARRIILEAGELDRDSPHYVAIRQLYARSIYKDEDLLAPQKFESAIEVLENDCALDASTDGETLGLAGSVYKRLWDHTGQRTHLEKALACYARAAVVAPDADGWLGVNAAYVSDLLGVQEGRAGGPESEARKTARFEEADRIRRGVLRKLDASGPPRDASPWYFHASRAEAAFGLEDFAGAAAALADGRAAIAGLPEHPLQQETTARQLAAIARIRFDGSPLYATASEVIQKAFGIGDHAVSALFGGKIGVALSGGGFRASLFHIGVLAKLAELDLLRHVEVISCVSGGSIIGAFYYLELKKLLESGNTSRADYLQLVEDVAKKFLAGVQDNLRTRVAASPWQGLKMALASGYSRSDVISELYQEHLYDHTAAAGKEPPRVMSDLTIQPAGFAGSFSPKYDNWRLSAKVPMLVLNATTMNTGHNWQFTATWMGESPQAISATIDAIPRYRRMHYKDAPPAHQRIPIGRAVGASACVPGLFEPIVLRNLYPDRTVRLIDGGVHDNQGLASLLEENCRVILISDASGQMHEQPSPGGSVPDSVQSSNGILQARVREAQFDQLTALRRAGAIQGAMFIHLTKDLEADPVSWVGQPAKPPKAQSATTSYGIDRDLQRKLAAVRTDLDSFSDAEAFALMTSGYRMTEHSLLTEHCLPSLPLIGTRNRWTFLAAEDALTTNDAKRTETMRELLSVSDVLAGKVWKQLWPLKAFGWLVAGAGVVGAGFALWKNRFTALPALGIVALVAIALVLVQRLLLKLDQKRIYHKRLGEVGLGAAIAVVVWIVARIHLLIFDRLFLHHGAWPDTRPPGPSAIVTSGPKLRISDTRAAGGGNVPPSARKPGDRPGPNA
jgi:predicted acylesterase/phospholipase RssA